MNIILVLALAWAPTPFIPPKPVVVPKVELHSGIHLLMWGSSEYSMTLDLTAGTYHAWRNKDNWVGTALWNPVARTLTVSEQLVGGASKYTWTIKFKDDLSTESVTGVNLKLQVLPAKGLEIR